MAPWLGCSSPDRAIRVQALAEDIIFCSLARPLTVPLTTQVYKCVMSQISHNIRVALQSDLWMRSDIIYRRRWQPLWILNNLMLGKGQPCGELAAYHLGGH